MADKTAIEWTDATWNPTRGCTRVSPGCGGPGKHGGCYAEGIAARFSGPGQPFHGFAEMRNGEARWTGKLALIDSLLTLPLRWKKPRRIFVNSMSDLFHEALPHEAIDKVFAVMALCPQHTFQVLTKRPERMRDYARSRGQLTADWNGGALVADAAEKLGDAFPGLIRQRWPYGHDITPGSVRRHWPLPNVWLGVSAERQQEADERIPLLLATPAAVRFVSLEPLLGPIDLRWLAEPDDDRDGVIDALTGRNWIDPLGGDGDDAFHPVRPGHEGRVMLRHFVGDHRNALDWAIVGGESGQHARPMRIEWANSLVDQCRTAGVACFVKQLGAEPMASGYPLELHDRKGGDWSEWPQDLRVRQFPETRP